MADSGRGMRVRYALIGAVLALIVVFGWRCYTGWTTGRIELYTERAPVLVQVLDETSDVLIGEPFDLAKRTVLTLPAGEYRLRVEGKGRLGRTYRFGVNRGETQAHTVSIDEGMLLGGERAPRAEEKKAEVDVFARHDGRDRTPRAEEGKGTRSDPFRACEWGAELTPGKARLIEWMEGSLICRDGATGEVVWDALHPSGAV